MSIGITAERREVNIEERSFPYRFSVILPVYMAEDYLAAAIESVLGQTMGFAEYVQLILIDDGSPDRSGIICDEYQAQFPNNIIVLHQANGGPSAARNAGLQYVEGRYVCFLDSDDKYSKTVMERVYEFFIEHEDEIDIVAINRTLFGALKGSSSANITYGHGSCIIDLLENYDIMQPTLAIAFIKHDIAKNICCDTELVIVEDRKEIFKIVAEKNKIGLVRGCTYYNRKREVDDNPSLTDQSTTTKSNYLPALQRYCIWAYDYYREKMGYIPQHVQFMIVLYLRKKALLSDFPAGLLTDEEQAEYLILLKRILLQTDDEVICKHKYLIPEAKNFFLYIKYDRWPKLTNAKKSVLFTHGETVVYDLRWGRTRLDSLSITGNTLHVSGYLITLMPAEKVRIFFHVNNEYLPAELFQHHQDRYALGEKIACTFGFKADIPLNTDKKLIKIKICVQLSTGAVVTRNNISLGELAPLNLRQRGSYYYKNGWKLTATKKAFYIRPCTRWGHVKAEIKLMHSLWRVKRSRNAVVFRLLFYIERLFKKREIWLITDDINHAGDNGEFLFRYLCALKDKKIQPIFSIKKETVDYQRLRKYGRVITPNNHRYKILFLLADKVVSSYDISRFTAPFGKGTHYYRDLYSDRVSAYLPNTTTKEYVAKTFDKNQKGYNLIMSSCVPEYQSILSAPHRAYQEEDVVLSGLPRFDYLYNNAQKIITVMPESREYLFKEVRSKKNGRITKKLRKGFPESRYCLFYSRLLNNKALLDAAARHNYRFRFIPHPNIVPYLDAFNLNESVEVVAGDVNYLEQYAESSLLVTDYSPAAFDFAYLRKPQIFCHFDYPEYRSFCGKDTCFDSEKSRFGDIETILDGTIKRIIDYIENECGLREEYRERINEAFPYNDQNNCQRVYETLRDRGYEPSEDQTETLLRSIPRYFEKPSVDNNSIAFVCNDLTEFYAMRVGLDALRNKNIPVDIFVSTNKAFAELEDYTADVITGLGYNVKPNNKENVEYKILLEPYPMNISKNIRYEFRIKYSYGAGTSKPNPTFMPHRNLHFDAFIHFNKRDAEARKVYGETYTIPFFQYKTIEKQAHGGKPNLLYLPTFGDVSSVGYLDDQTVADIKQKYNFIIKSHHAIQFREDEQENYSRIRTIADEFYNSDTPIIDLLVKADLVLSDNSGAILDSIYSETPVAIFSKDPNQRKLNGISTTHNELVRAGIVPCASQAEEIMTALDRAVELFDKQKEFKNSNYVLCEDEPTDAFVSIIERYLNKKRQDDIYFMAHDVLLNDYVQRSEEARMLRIQVGRLEKRIADFEDSGSWKATKPFRRVKKLLKKQ